MLETGQPLNLKGLSSEAKDELLFSLWTQIQQSRDTQDKLSEELSQLKVDNQKLLEANSLLHQALEKAHARIEVLEGQLAKNSRNSSKPPSSDNFKKPKPKSQREAGKRNTGGQKGHLGITLLQVETPDVIVRHTAEVCEKCQKSLTGALLLGFEKRQEFDLPPIQAVVTEHQAEITMCPFCGCKNKGKFPENIVQPVQYGPRSKAVASYLSHYQLLPYARLTELFEDVFKFPLSEGTLFNVTKTCYDKLETYELQVQRLLIESPVVHFDESGIRVKKKLNWLHVASTTHLTYYTMHEKRGFEAMEAIGILPSFKGIAIHDHWKPYFYYQTPHGLCNAHHFRELIYHEEQYGQQWAKKLHDCLLEAKTEVEAHKIKGELTMDPARLCYFEQQYDHILTIGLEEIPPVQKTIKKRGRPKQHPAKNLLDRLQNFKRETLAFMYDFRASFTNNQAENDIRMIKVKQKVSGCFRSSEGAKMFLRTRGYISTARKHTLNPLEALTDVFKGTPFIPSLSV